MRNLFLLLVLFSILSCENIKSDLTKEERFYIRNSFDGIEKIPYQNFPELTTRHDTIVSVNTEIDGKTYTIVKMADTTDYTEMDPSQGEYFLEKSIGIIYVRLPHISGKYKRLMSTNDSTNYIIDRLIDYILVDPRLCHYIPGLPVPKK